MSDLSSGHGEFWREKAQENIEEWGKQDPETLLLAAQEELGELSRAYLESNYEDGGFAETQEELDDLAALMFQLEWAFEREGNGERH